MNAPQQKTPINFNGVEYIFEELTERQQYLFKHCVDLDQQIGHAQFKLEQLSLAKNGFVDMLDKELKIKKKPLQNLRNKFSRKK